MYNRHKQSYQSGKGLLNTFINKLPFELHVPGYRYLGPGTKLDDKLAKNTSGINLLDEAAKQHDIAYSRHKDLESRHRADKELEYKAWDRVTSPDAKLSEKAAAWFTTNAMKLKRKFGAGVKKNTYTHRKRKRTVGRGVQRKQRTKRNRSIKSKGGKGITFNQLVKKAKQAISDRGKKNSDIQALAARSLSAIKKYKIKNKPHNKRILALPKIGGAIPLIPILAALSHVGSLVGGVTAIVNAIKNIKDVKDQYKAQQGSGIAFTPYRIGHKLLIHPHKRGLGLFVT
jgi:hypothetical protein